MSRPLTSSELHIHVIVYGVFQDTSPPGTNLDGVVHGDDCEITAVGWLHIVNSWYLLFH